ncbi:FitA-like ribbon-helix-helix domain-containing protein [Culicoidibacter larvae]|uniref:Ribbon-helix-helix protein, CopG family n=1 Tax=Culicoidibacter larvae TaxID=2579976 RepID=A0A5R8Q6X2_9FIRM|nr:ribbon-helix-helix protein, CopG family [Culicoidibacter larvae]TLG71170.1 ribbon-helix-helix protein, CopG family [Culicoidibacter larvae]
MKDKQEIRVRNVPKDIVAILDEQAKRSGLSREEFLREWLEIIAKHGLRKDIDMQYGYLLGELLNAFHEQTIVINNLVKVLGGEDDE